MAPVDIRTPWGYTIPAEADLLAIEQHILQWILGFFGGEQENRDTVRATLARGMVPIGFAPVLFCLQFGNPKVPLDDDEFQSCLVKWSRETAKTVLGRTPAPRHPSTWIGSRDWRETTPDWLWTWDELKRWTKKTHGLSLAEYPPPVFAADPDTSPLSPVTPEEAPAPSAPPHQPDNQCPVPQVCQPKGPGRPSTNREAYGLIDELMAGGKSQYDACAEAAAKYPAPGKPLPDRAENLADGYRKYRKAR
jgi:hypothetical protein